MIFTISKATCVTRNTATVIGHLFTNTAMDNIEMKTAIVKTNISNRFSIIFATKIKIDAENLEQYIFKYNFSDLSIDKFKHKITHYGLE